MPSSWRQKKVESRVPRNDSYELPFCTESQDSNLQNFVFLILRRCHVPRTVSLDLTKSVNCETFVKFEDLADGNHEDNLCWDVTLCSLAESSGRFGGTYCFHLHCRRMSQENSSWQLGLPFYIEDRGCKCLRSVCKLLSDHKVSRFRRQNNYDTPYICV
jgi:hypothetical protein